MLLNYQGHFLYLKLRFRKWKIIDKVRVELLLMAFCYS